MRTIVAALLILATTQAAADLVVGTGVQVTQPDPFIEDDNGYAVFVRTDHQRWNAFAGTWNGKNDNTVGGVDVTVGDDVIEARAGLAVMKQTNERVGTNFNFELFVGVNVGRARVGWLHFSNGKKIFNWQHDKPNQGEDFVVVEWRF